MRKTRAWRTATAGLAAATLLTMMAGPASAQVPGLPGLPELPGLPGAPGDDGGDGGEGGESAELGAGGFAGCASAQGLSVSVALPEELAPVVQPLKDALAPDRTPFGAFCPEEPITFSGSTITIDLSRAQAELARADADEEATPFVQALATNLILGNTPCTGVPSVDLPPDADVPLLSIDLLNVDCDESDPARAYAGATVAGVNLNLGALVPLSDGALEPLVELFDQILAPVNEQLIDGLVQEGVLDPACGALSQIPGLGDILEDCLGLTSDELEVLNPLDVQVPLLDLGTLETDSEVTFEDGVVTASARSTIANAAILGLVCLEGTDAGSEFAYTAVATSDGVTATADATSTNVTARLCDEPRILEVLPVEGLLASVGIGGTTLLEALDGVGLEPVTAGLEQLLSTLGVVVADERAADVEEVDGGTAIAQAAPFSVAVVSPFSQLPGLDTTPLADIAVTVAGLGTTAAVTAEPEGLTPNQPPTDDGDPDEDPDTPAGPTDPTTPTTPDRRLPRTGAGAGILLGLAALGGAAALRRRDG